jgi:branched-chain amino acid transport system permease protein
MIPMPEVLRIADEWRLVLYGLAVVVVIMVRPEGILGFREFSLKGIVSFYNETIKRRPVKRC